MDELEDVKKDLEYFEKMITGAQGIVEKSSRPWKWAVICLVIAVTICITGWALSVITISNRHMDTIDRLTDQIITLEQDRGG